MNDKVIAIALETDAAAPAAAHEPMYVHLAISDPEVILAASEYPEGRPRTDFIQTALKIGVLSLRAARGVVDGEAIRRGAIGRPRSASSCTRKRRRRPAFPGLPAMGTTSWCAGTPMTKRRTCGSKRR